MSKNLLSFNQDSNLSEINRNQIYPLSSARNQLLGSRNEFDLGSSQFLKDDDNLQQAINPDIYDKFKNEYEIPPLNNKII